MNVDRARAPAAIVLSILAHASAAMLGHFELGEAGSVAGSLSVSVAGYANPATPQLPRDVPTESVDRPESTPDSAADVEPEPVVPETAVADEVLPVQEQVKEPPVAKPVKKPVHKEVATAQPAKKAPSEPVERKSAPVASFIEATKKSAVSKPQPVAPSSEAQETDTASMYQADPTGRAAAKGIVAAITPEMTAIPLYHLIPKPVYPSRSRDLGEEGMVIIAILVAANGSVADAYVSTSSGYSLLDGSALSTVKAKWRFRPAINRGKPVASWVRAPINFNIK